MRLTLLPLLILLAPLAASGCCTIYLGDSLDGVRFGEVQLARDRDQGELDFVYTAKYGKQRKAERWILSEEQLEAFRYRGPMNRLAIIEAARQADPDALADALLDVDASGGADLAKVETLWERDIRGVSVYIFFDRDELVSAFSKDREQGRPLPELDILTVSDARFRGLSLSRDFDALPPGTRVYLFPKKLPVSAWGTTKNVIKYFLFPITVALDIATFPIQVIFLGASGDD